MEISFVTDETNWSEDSILANIDTAYRPRANVQFLGYVYGDNTSTQLSLGIDGKLRIYGQTGYTNKRLRGYILYVYA